MQILTETEAYEAMVAFLDKYYELTGADDIGGLLGSLRVIADGRPADPAMWQDWLEAIGKIRKSNPPV